MSAPKPKPALPQDNLIPKALQGFRKIAAPLGLKIGMFSATLLSSHEKPGSVVMRLVDGERALLLKWAEQQAQARDLVASALAQEIAREALWGFPKLKVPKVLAQSIADRVVLMEEPQGTPLETRMVEGGNLGLLLGQAAQWLAAFHQETFAEDRLFQSVYVKNHLNRMIDEVSKRPDSIPASTEFLAHAETLKIRAEALQDHPIRSSQSHGDMTLRHMVVSGDHIAATDFRPMTKASGAIDTARILSDVAQIVLPLAGETKDLGLPAQLQAAFFTSYPGLAPQDPILHLMLRVRILAEWRAMPTRPAARSWRQDRRWAYIRSLDPNLLSA